MFRIRVTALLLGSALVLAASPASGEGFGFLASLGPASAAPVETPRSPRVAEIVTSGTDSFVLGMSHALGQRTRRAYATVDSFIGLFAGGSTLRFGNRGSVLDLEGGASIRLTPNLYITGGYRALGYDRSLTGSGGLAPQKEFTFFGVDWKY